MMLGKPRNIKTSIIRHHRHTAHLFKNFSMARTIRRFRHQINKREFHAMSLCVVYSKTNRIFANLDNQNSCRDDRIKHATNTYLLSKL